MVFGTSVADVPQTMSYQGVLADGSGVPVPDGTYNLTFRLYSVAIGGTPLWSEIQALVVEDAIFNAILGSVTTLNLPFDNPYWLGVSVDGGAELTPRVALTTAPYAFRTRYGDGDWEFSGSNIYRMTGNVGVGTASPSARIDVSTGADRALELTSSGTASNMTLYAKNTSGSVGCFYTMGATGYPGTPTAVYGAAGEGGMGGFFTCYGDSDYGLLAQSHGDGTALWGWAYNTGYAGYFTGGKGLYCSGMTETQQFKMSTGPSNGYVLTSDASGVGTWQPASGGGIGGSGTANYIPKFTASTTVGNSMMYDSGTAVGVGTTSPGAALGVERTTHGLGLEVVSTYSGTNGRLVNLERTGTPVAGNDMLQIAMPTDAPDGVQYIECERGGSIEFRVNANGDVYDHGDVMVDGLIDVDSDTLRAGDFTSNYLSGSTHVVHAEITGTGSYDGVAVYGESVPTDYYGIGGYFVGGYRGVYGTVVPTGSSSYRGVYGAVSGGTGSNYGVYGYAYGGATNYGVYGYASGGSTNYAGYFSGNVHVTGTLSKGGGSFKIDHPLEPETKYLYHSFVESPDMMNVYNGNVVLDASGAARVEMPDWFEAVNRDFRYQLTAIGAPGPNLYIAEKVSGNQFRIAGGEPGMEVSWMVTGIRHDAFAETNRIPVEEDKPANEVGKYLHPDAYGLPATMSVDYVEEERRVEPEEDYADPRERHRNQGIDDDSTD
jgi:hypothetical protein